MKHKSWMLTALLVPLACIFLVYLRVEHFVIDQEIRRQESLQERLIERNRRYIAQESMLSSPDRIRQIAQESEGFSMARPGQTIYFSVQSNPEPLERVRNE